MMFSLALYSQKPQQVSEDQVVRFTESTAIRSLDGGASWQLLEGSLKDIPYWAQSWLKSEIKPPSSAWTPRSATIELADGGILRQDAETKAWKLEAADRRTVPAWFQSWLKEAPNDRPALPEAVPVQSLCQGENPIQRTQNLQLGPDLAIRSFDGGNTWVMAQGKRDELPGWAKAWLSQPVTEVHPAKDIEFGEAMVRSVDKGLTWSLVKGKMEDLPDWVRPWLGDNYPAHQPPIEARSAESTLPGGFELFPNPTRDKVTLRFLLQRAQEVHVHVYDLQGRRMQEIQQGNLPQGTNELNFSVAELAAGAYFIQFSSEDRHERIRLLKQH